MMIDDIPFAIPTANKMGYDSQTLDKYYAQSFIDYVTHISSPTVLEIGTGYGIATLAALSVGASVTANDLDRYHLDILKSKIPSSLLPQLTLKVGKFPQDLTFESNSFDAILISQVLHFLTGEEIGYGLPLLLNWLKPEGKIFLTAISPHMGVLQDFLPIYQERKKQKQPWPGEIENLKQYCHHPCSDLNPTFIHVFDPDVLEYNFTQAGFKVEKVDFFPIRQSAEIEFKNNGHECVGIIASKPLG